MACEIVSEKAAQRSNYRRLRDAIWEIGEPFDRYGDMIREDIFRLVRERFGCPATKLPDSDIPVALAFAAQLGRLIADSKAAAEWVARDAREVRVSAIKERLFAAIYGRRETPVLRLVPNCGRDLEGRVE